MKSPPNWPPPEIDLLLRSLLLPESAAERAWRRWSAGRELEDIRFGEARLLAPLARRLRELDPLSPRLARIEGVARADWTRTLATLEQSVPALDLLCHRKVSVLLLGTAAHHAEGRGRDRLVTEIELLVQPEDRANAVKTLLGDGWHEVLADSPAWRVGRSSPETPVVLHREKQGRVRVRSRAFPPFHANRSPSRELWSTAIVAELRGRPVSIPSPETATLLSLAWGAREASGGWAIDLARRFADAPPDWTRVVHDARRWGLVPAALGGLHYLGETLDQPVPSSSLQALEKSPTTLTERVRYRAHLPGSKKSSAARRLIGGVADRLVWIQTQYASPRSSEGFS